MNADTLLKLLEKRLGKGIIESRIEKRDLRTKKTFSTQSIWVKVNKEAFKPLVAELCKAFPNPHFAVISGYQEAETITLIYHFSINYALKFSELYVNVKVDLPKKKVVMPTITDLIPGALISEREIQEMLGVTIEGIPDSRRLFLDKTFPKGVFPWRRDKTGPDKLVRNLHGDDKK